MCGSLNLKGAYLELDSDLQRRQLGPAELLLKLAADMKLFHSPDGKAYADIFVSGHRETWRVGSKGFEHHLRKRFFDETSRAPNADALRTAVETLETRAQFEATEREVYVRIASFERDIYVDLGDPDWRAIKIAPEGWVVINDPPVRFLRPAGMKPLPQPERRGSIEALRPFLNLRSEQDFVLVVAWLLAAIRHPGPYPVLALAGEHGSAKSTCSLIFRELIDPNSTGPRSLPRDDRETFIAAGKGHLLAFDNLSLLPGWFSDCLCRLATGGGHAVRRLYTDEEEILFKAQRPIILNGIEDLVTRPDLADRTIFITLEPITNDRRLSEQDLWSKFEAERPVILGALLDIAAYGLRTLPEVAPEALGRMADFELWAMACEGAQWARGTFQRAYYHNREETMQNAIEADSVALAVCALMDMRTPQTVRTQISEMSRQRIEWEGTATALLRELNTISNESIGRDRSWPQTANALSNRLRRAARILRERGVEIIYRKQGRDRTRIIRIFLSSDNQGLPSYEPRLDEARCEEAEITIEKNETEGVIDEPRSAPVLTSTEASSASSTSSAHMMVPLKPTKNVVPKPTIPKVASCVIPKPNRNVVLKPPGNVVLKPPGNVIPKHLNVVPKPQRAR